MSKKLFSLTFLVFSTLFLFGCQGGNPNATKRLVVAIESEPNNLNPLYATDANSQNADALIFNGLVDIGPDLRPREDLAYQIRIRQGRFYRVIIKPNVKFHHGRDVTSVDVVNSIKVYQDPIWKSPFRGAFQKIKNIKIKGKNTFTFETDKVEPGLMVDLYLLKILPKEFLDKGTFSDVLIGTGPFKLVEKNSSRILLKRNEHYFGKKPKIEEIELKIIKDETTKYLKLKKGEIDLAYNNMSPQKVDFIKKQGDLLVKSAAGTGYNYIGFNLKDKKFQDVRVRRALAHALDIEKVIKYKMKGLARRAESVLAPEFYYHAKIKPIPFNPEAAKKLLDEAGYPVDPKTGMRNLVFEWKTSTNRSSVAIARVLSDMFRQVGVQSTVRSYEWGTFYGDIKAGNFEVYSLRWIGHVGPEFLYDLYHSKEPVPEGFHSPYFNRVGYSNPEVDQLLQKGMNSTEPRVRRPHFTKAQKLISNDIPYISLWYPDVTAIYRPEVEGVTLHPTGSWKALSLIRKNANETP